MSEIISVTKAVNCDMRNKIEMTECVHTALGRFLQGDWGDIDPYDREINNSEQKERDGLILGKYTTVNGDIYITRIFDEPSVGADVVTVMYCDEY